MKPQRVSLDVTNFPDSGTLEQQILQIIEYGIRAPSTHNTQPWIFEFTGATVAVSLDTTRSLAYADRTGRDLYMSIGCLLTNIEIAAAYFRMHCTTEIGTADNTGLVAKITFEKSTGRNEEFSALLTAIDQRYNARGPLLPLSEAARQAIMETQLVGGVVGVFVENNTNMQKLGQITESGICAFHNNPNFRKEFSGWMRGNYSQLRNGIHGYSVFMNDVVSYIAPIVMRFINMGKMLGKLNAEGIAGAPLAAILLTEHDLPSDWIAAGKSLELMALRAFTQGAAASFYAAPIEHGPAREELRAMTNTTALLPQFLVVFGVPEKVLPTTPRESIASHTRPSTPST